jgi:hypothetical protein
MTRGRTRNEMCALSSVMEDSIWCNVNDKNSDPTGPVSWSWGKPLQASRSDANGSLSDKAYGQG